MPKIDHVATDLTVPDIILCDRYKECCLEDCNQLCYGQLKQKVSSRLSNNTIIILAITMILLPFDSEIMRGLVESE